MAEPVNMAEMLRRQREAKEAADKKKAAEAAAAMPVAIPKPVEVKQAGPPKLRPVAPKLKGEPAEVVSTPIAEKKKVSPPVDFTKFDKATVSPTVSTPAPGPQIGFTETYQEAQAADPEGVERLRLERQLGITSNPDAEIEASIKALEDKNPNHHPLQIRQVHNQIATNMAAVDKPSEVINTLKTIRKSLDETYGETMIAYHREEFNRYLAAMTNKVLLDAAKQRGMSPEQYVIYVNKENPGMNFDQDIQAATGLPKLNAPKTLASFVGELMEPIGQMLNLATTGRLMSDPYVAPKAEDYTPEAKAARAEKTAAVKRGMGFGEPVAMKEINDELELGMYRIPTAGLTGSGMGGTMPSDLSATRGADATAVASELLKNAAVTIGDEQAIMRIVNQNNETGDWQKASSQIATEFVPVITKMHPELNVDDVGKLANRQALRLMAAMRNTGQWSSPIYITREDWENGELKRVSLPNPANDVEVVGITSNGQIISRQMTYAAALANTITGALEYGVVGGVRTARQIYNDVESASKTYQRNLAEGKSYAEASAAMLSQLESEDTWDDLVKNTQLAAATQADLIGEAATYAERNQLTTLPTTVLVGAALAASVFMPDIGEVGLAAKERYVGDFNRQSILAKTQAINPKWVEPVDAMMDSVLKIPGMDYLSLGSAAAPVRTLDAGVDAANKGQELWFDGKREEAIASFEEAEAKSESILRNQSSKVERDVEVKNADGSTRIEKQFIDAGTGRLIMETVDRLEGELTRKVIESRGASKNVETVVAANDLYDYKVANALNRLGQAVKNKWSMDVNLSNLVRRTSTQSYATRFGVASDLKALVAFDAKSVDAAALADLSRAEILRGISDASIRDGLKDFDFNSLLASKVEDVPQILFDYLQSKGFDFEANPKSLADITKDTETLLGRIKKEDEISTLLEDKDSLVNRAINSVILQREIRTTASSVVSHVARRTGGKQMTVASAMDEKLLGEKNDLSIAEATRVAQARVDTKAPKISMMETLKMRFGLKPDETKLSASARKHLDEVMKFVGGNKEEAITLLLLADARARVVSNISGRPMDAWWRQTIQDIRVLKGEGTIAGSGKLAGLMQEFSDDDLPPPAEDDFFTQPKTQFSRAALRAPRKTEKVGGVESRKLNNLAAQLAAGGFTPEEIMSDLNNVKLDSASRDVMVKKYGVKYADKLSAYQKAKASHYYSPITQSFLHLADIDKTQLTNWLLLKTTDAADIAKEIIVVAEQTSSSVAVIFNDLMYADMLGEPMPYSDLLNKTIASGVWNDINTQKTYETKAGPGWGAIQSQDLRKSLAEIRNDSGRGISAKVALGSIYYAAKTPITKHIASILYELTPEDAYITNERLQQIEASYGGPLGFNVDTTLGAAFVSATEPTHIWLNSDNQMTGEYSPEYVVLHECVHAVTINAIERPRNPVEERFRDNISALYNYAKDNYGKDLRLYGLVNEKEFIAVALSNREFAEVLRKMPYVRRGTIWSNVLSAFYRFFSIEPTSSTVLSETLRAFDELLTLRLFDEEQEAILENAPGRYDEWGFKLFSKETASPVSAKGSVEFNTRTGAAIIEGYARADASTFVHELAHVIRTELSPSDMDRLVATLRDEYGIEVGHDGRGNFIDIESIDVDEPTVSIDEDTPTVVEPEVEVVDTGDVGDEDKDTPTVVSSTVPEDEDPKTTVMSDTDRAKALTANYNARKINALTTPTIPDKLVKTTPEAQRKAATIAASLKAASARVDELKASLAEFDTDEMKTTKAFKETTKKLEAAETRLAEVLESESPILNARVAYTKAEAKYSIAKNAADKAIKSYELRRDGDIAVKSGERLGDFKAKAEEAIEEALARRTELSETIVLWEDAMKTEAAKVSPNAVAKVTAAQKARLELEERKAAEAEKAAQKSIKAEEKVVEPEVVVEEPKVTEEKVVEPEVGKEPEAVQEVKEANVVEEPKVVEPEVVTPTVEAPVTPERNSAFEQRLVDQTTTAIMKKKPFAELSDKAEAAVRVRAIVELMRDGSLEAMKDSVNYGTIADVLGADGVTVDSVIGTLKDEINSIYGINISGFEHKTKGGKKLFPASEKKATEVATPVAETSTASSVAKSEITEPKEPPPVLSRKEKIILNKQKMLAAVDAAIIKAETANETSEDIQMLVRWNTGQKLDALPEDQKAAAIENARAAYLEKLRKEQKWLTGEVQHVIDGKRRPPPEPVNVTRIMSEQEIISEIEAHERYLQNIIDGKDTHVNYTITQKQKRLQREKQRDITDAEKQKIIQSAVKEAQAHIARVKQDLVEKQETIRQDLLKKEQEEANKKKREERKRAREERLREIARRNKEAGIPDKDIDDDIDDDIDIDAKNEQDDLEDDPEVGGSRGYTNELAWELANPILAAEFDFTPQEDYNYSPVYDQIMLTHGVPDLSEGHSIETAPRELSMLAFIKHVLDSDASPFTKEMLVQLSPNISDEAKVIMKYTLGEITDVTPDANAYAQGPNIVFMDKNVSSLTIVHEIAHTVTTHVLYNKDDPRTIELQKLFDYVKNQKKIQFSASSERGVRATYGMKNLQEFAAEIFSNPTFYSWLDTIPYTEKETVWNKVTQVFLRILGFDTKKKSPTVLTEAVATLEKIITPSSKRGADRLPQGYGFETEKGILALKEEELRILTTTDEVTPGLQRHFDHMEQYWTRYNPEAKLERYARTRESYITNLKQSLAESQLRVNRVKDALSHIKALDEIYADQQARKAPAEEKTISSGKKLFQSENVEIVDKRFFRSVLQDALPRVFKDAKQIKAASLLNKLNNVQGLTRNELLFTGLEQKLVELGQKPITLAEAMEVASKSYEYSVRIQGGDSRSSDVFASTKHLGGPVRGKYLELDPVFTDLGTLREKLEFADVDDTDNPIPLIGNYVVAEARRKPQAYDSWTAEEKTLYDDLHTIVVWQEVLDTIPKEATAVKKLLSTIPMPWNVGYLSGDMPDISRIMRRISLSSTIEKANAAATKYLDSLPSQKVIYVPAVKKFITDNPDHVISKIFDSSSFDVLQEEVPRISSDEKMQLVEKYISDVQSVSPSAAFSDFIFPGENIVNILLDVPDPKYTQRAFDEEVGRHFGLDNLAHARGSTQVIDGKKYFFLQEIQSDKMQAITKGEIYAPSRLSHPETNDWTQAMVRAAVKYAVETGHEGIILPDASVIMPYNLSLPKTLVGNEKAIQEYLGPPSPKEENVRNKRDTYEGAAAYYKNLVPGIIQKELASKAAQVTIPWKPSNYNKDVTSLPELNISATEQATLAATADVAPTREGITTIKAAADHMEDVLQKAASAVLSEDIRTNLHRVRDRISLRKMNFEFAVMQMDNIYSPESKISIPAKLLEETNDLGAAMRAAAKFYDSVLKQTAPQDKSFSAQAIDFTPEIKSKYAKPQPLFQPEPDTSKPGIKITIDDSKYSEEVRKAEEAWAEVIESVFKNKELSKDAPPIFGQVADVVRQYVNETARTVDGMIPENNIRDQFMDQFDPETASPSPFGKTVINPLSPDADLKALFNDVDLTNPMAAQEAMNKRLKAIKNELTNFPDRQPQELLDEQDLIERRLAAIKQTPEYKTALLRELKKKLADDNARYGSDIPSYVASKMDKLRKKIDFLEKDLIMQEMPSPLPFDGMQTDEALNLAATEIAKTVPEKTLSDKFFQQMVNSPKWATIGGFFTGFGADEKWAQRAIPPEARTTFMTAIRPIQETISDISRLITEGSENLASTKKTLIEAAQSGDVKATSVFEYLNGRQTKFGSGMPTVTSGINHVDWATARIQSKWHGMDIADQNLVQRYFDACGVDTNGNAKTYVSGLDANTASAAAAILNKLLSDADRSDARSNAANPGDLFLGMAKQSVWPNIGVEDAPKLHAWLMSLFHVAEVITPTNKEGYTVIADNAMRLVSALSYNVSSNIEAPHHAAVWLATHGGLQHSRSAIKNQAFGVPKEDAVMFDKWKRGQFDPKMDYAKMDSIARKYGLTATFELAPELGINDVMLPSKLRAEIRNELLHGRRLLTSDEQLALQFGADPQKIFAGEYKSDFITDVLSGIVMGIRKSSVLGLFFNRPQGFTNDAIGVYDAVANNSRFKTAAAATIQRSLQLAITNTPILSDLLDALGLAARFTGSDNRVAKIQTKIRQALSNAGDNVSKAIISSASAARSLPLVTEIIDGSPDKYIEVNGTRYTHYDLRQIWLQEGVFATFERGQTSEALFNEVTPKTGLSAEKRLRRAANTFSRYRYEQSNEAGTFVRVGVASAYLQMGYDPRTAARAAVATTFDYVNSTTGWDKNLIYNVFFPFQAFRKNNARFIMNRLTTYSSIRKIAMTYRLLSGIPDAFEALAIAEQREDGNEYGVKVNELNEDSMEEFEQMRLILEEGYSPMFGTDATKWPDDVKSHIAGTPEAFNSQWTSMDEKGKNLLVYGYGGYANVPLNIKQSMNMFFSGATRIVSSDQPSMLERRRMQPNEDIIRKDSNIPVDEDAFASRNRFMYDYQLNRPSGTFSIESGPKVDAIRNRADQQSIRQRGGTGTDSTPAIVGSLAETMFMSQANVLGVGMAVATLTYRAGEALGEYAFDATDEDLARWKTNPSGTFEEEDIEPDRSSPYYSISQFLGANAGTLKQINDPERTALIGDILKMQAGEERAALLHPLVGQVLAAAPGGFGVTIDTSGVEPKYYLTPEGKLALTVSLRTFPIELSNMLLRTESVIDVTRDQPKTQSAAAVQDTIGRGDYADPATVLYILKSAGFQVSEQAPSSVMSAVQPRWSEKTSTPK